MVLQQWDECLPLLESNLHEMQLVHGPNHPETLDTAWVLGRAYNRAEDHERSLQVLEPTHQAMVDRFGPTNPRTLRCLTSLVITQSNLGNLEQACELQEFVLRSSEQRLGTDHINTNTAALNYGMLFIKTERFEEAERELRALIDTMQGQTNMEPHTLLRAKSSLGEVLTHQQQFDEAESQLIAAYDGLTALNAAENSPMRRYRLDATQGLVRLYKAWGKPKKAQQWTEVAPLPRSGEDSPP